jgi:replicative DNA helicase
MSNRNQPDYALPADIPCERTLLGAVLKQNEAWEAVSQLAPDDWSLDSHKRIRMAMKRLKDAGSGIDDRTLSNELARTKELEAIGGLAYLMDLQEGIYRNIYIEDHLKIVRDKGLLRRLLHLSNDIADRAQDQSETGMDILSDAASKLEKFSEPFTKTADASIQSFLVEAIAEIDHEYQNRTSPCIPTGIPWLDSMTGGGLRHGNIFLICARPNIGKTPALLQMMVHNLQRGMKCVLFSLEKPKRAILRDLIPHVVDIPNRVVNNAWMQTPEQNRLIHDAAETIAGWNLKIYDEKMDGDQICWTIKRESKNDEEVLYGLDHFGMVAGRRGEDPVERDNYISGGIRDTIKHTRSAIAILRQLRKVKREFAESAPVPDDVKGSGNAVEDAFGALIIHRAINAETRKMSLEAMMNLFKLRTGGSTGSTTGKFNPRILRFDAEAETEELQYEAQDWHQ